MFQNLSKNKLFFYFSIPIISILVLFIVIKIRHWWSDTLSLVGKLEFRECNCEVDNANFRESKISKEEISNKETIVCLVEIYNTTNKVFKGTGGSNNNLMNIKWTGYTKSGAVRITFTDSIKDAIKPKKSLKWAHSATFNYTKQLLNCDSKESVFNRICENNFAKFKKWDCILSNFKAE